MIVFFSIGHPKDVHTYRNLCHRLKQAGYECIAVCNNRQYNVELLEHFRIDHFCISEHAKNVFGKVLILFKETSKLLKLSREYSPDIFISHSSLSLGIIARICGKPHIAIEDTFNMEQVRLSMLFTDTVLTGNYTHPSLGKKEIRYPGYHELAYLHPNVFFPNESVLNSLRVKKCEKYAIIRFVAWAATHDIGHKGMSMENKKKLVEVLTKHLKVFISSEEELPPDLKKYQIPIKSEDMHSALAFAHLFFGESSTMATESAVLGTPSVYINDSQLGYIKDLERRGLIFSFTESSEDQVLAINKSIDIAINDKSIYESKAKKMLKDKIDVTAFLEWYVSNYPSSKREMMKDTKFDFSRFR